MYTHGHHETVLRSHQWRTAANSAGYLVPHLRPGWTVLDVGCGPGTITADLAALVDPGRVLGVDTAAEVLDTARQHAAEQGRSNVDVALADVYALDLADGAFDVVHAHQVLQHLADPVRALRQLRRVCRPGGLVAARDADYAAMTWYPPMPALDDWLALYQRVARHNGGEPDAGRRLLGWARQAGFAELTGTASAWCFATAADRDWWAGSWAGRCTRSAFAEQALAYGYTTRAGLERIAAGWRGWAQEPDGWFSVLHGEILCRA